MPIDRTGLLTRICAFEALTTARAAIVISALRERRKKYFTRFLELANMLPPRMNEHQDSSADNKCCIGRDRTLKSENSCDVGEFRLDGHFASGNGDVRGIFDERHCIRKRKSRGIITIPRPCWWRRRDS